MDAQRQESKLVADLRGFDGTAPIVTLRELLTVKLNQYKDRLVQQDDPAIRGRAQECIDLLKCIDNK